MSESVSIIDSDGEDRTVPEEFRIEEIEEQLSCLSPDKRCTGFSEAYLLIQKNHQEKDRLRKEIVRLEHEQDEILAVMASEIFDLGKHVEELGMKQDSQERPVEAKGLEIILRRMWALLQERNVKVLDLAGKPVNDEILKDVRVLKYIKEPGTADPIVKETTAPVVRRDDRLIQTGLIIVTVGENKI